MTRQTLFNKAHVENTGKKVLDSSFRVPTFLGPGLLESTYEACLKKDLENNGITVDSCQWNIPLKYTHIA